MGISAIQQRSEPFCIVSMKLTAIQASFLASLKPGRRYQPHPYYNRTIQALARKNAIHVTDCGMCTADGKTCYIIERHS